MGYNIIMIYSKIPRSKLKNFYQAKFDYYRKVSSFCAIVIALIEIMYFFTDCQLFGRFAYETLIPRLSVLGPLALYLYLAPKIKTYKLGIFLYYTIPHAAMWSTIWAIYYLDNKDFAREGFIVMHFAFLAIGMAMPVFAHIPIHACLIINIILSNQFNHYEHYDMMITLSIPLIIGVTLMLVIIENTYADAYLIRKQLENNSVSDKLTGIYNRYVLNDIINPKTEKFSIQADNIHILMFDVDYFKTVNDTYGHEGGDQILQFVSLQIKSQLYKNDYIIRWGGEEFIAVLVDYENDNAIRLAEKLRKDISNIDNGICPITISIGIYECSKSDTYKEAIDKADQALYYAKEHGRNQVVTYSGLNNTK